MQLAKLLDERQKACNLFERSKFPSWCTELTQDVLSCSRGPHNVPHSDPAEKDISCVFDPTPRWAR